MPTNTADIELKIGLSDSDKASMQAAITALVKASLITVYSSSATYALGDFVYYDGKFYKCTTAISTAEAWTSGHWTEATLNDVINKVNQAANSVENKITRGIGERDGTLKVGKADVSDNWTPYSDESGAFQDNPMISQGTGTDNNTAIVTTGNYAQLREKQGNTLAVAQLGRELNSTYWSAYSGTVSFNDGIATFTSSNKYGSFRSIYSISLLSGHKYIILCNLKLTTSTNNVFVDVSWDSGNTYEWQRTRETTDKQIVSFIVSPTGSYSDVVLKVWDNRSEGWDAVSIYSYLFFDITSWPADVISDLTDHPDHFPWYYNGSLAYDNGSLKNANGVKLVCTKRNLLDPSKFETGKSISSDGTLTTDANWSTSDYTVIPPNANIYFRNVASSSQRIAVAWFDSNKLFIKTTSIYNSGDVASDYRQAPSNASFVRITTKNTYVNNCDISLYYTPEEGGEGYNQHYDYEEPTVIDTGSEQLLAFDKKLPDGTIERNTVDINLADLTFAYDSTNGYWRTNTGVTALNPQHINSNVTMAQGIKSDRYVPHSVYEWDTRNERDIVINVGNAQCYIITSDGTTPPSGHIQCLVADSAKTTSQGTPFPENIEIDDYGMMYWLDEDDNLVGIPQGAKFFYPINYKGFTDDLYHRTNGHAGNVVIQSELAQYVKQVDVSDQITDVAGLSYSIKKAYKAGNIVTLTIRATNSTGSAISADTTLFTLGEDLKYGSTALLVVALVDGTQTYVRLNVSSGNSNCAASIPSGNTISIFVSYAVA